MVLVVGVGWRLSVTSRHLSLAVGKRLFNFIHTHGCRLTSQRWAKSNVAITRFPPKRRPA